MYILRSKHTWFAENPMIWGSPIIFRKNMDDYYCDSMKFRKSDKSSDRVGAFFDV